MAPNHQFGLTIIPQSIIWPWNIITIVQERAIHLHTHGNLLCKHGGYINTQNIYRILHPGHMTHQRHQQWGKSDAKSHGMIQLPK